VLREFPEAGHRIRKRSNIRTLVERPIIIEYRVKTDRIEILRFWHGAIEDHHQNSSSSGYTNSFICKFRTEAVAGALDQAGDDVLALA
jgi:hypothetical protein